MPSYHLEITSVAELVCGSTPAPSSVACPQANLTLAMPSRMVASRRSFRARRHSCESVSRACWRRLRLSPKKPFLRVCPWARVLSGAPELARASQEVDTAPWAAVPRSTSSLNSWITEPSSWAQLVSRLWAAWDCSSTASARRVSCSRSEAHTARPQQPFSAVLASQQLQPITQLSHLLHRQEALVGADVANHEEGGLV